MAVPTTLEPPATGDSWLGLTAAPLPVHDASDWVVRPDCGAVVVFSGTARDHSEGRVGVHRLEYEAYESQVVSKLSDLTADARTKWPDLGRVAVLHRTGEVAIGDAAVIVAVSAPHRDHAFEAGRFLIDTLKSTVPIWKREAWTDGESWGLEAQELP